MKIIMSFLGTVLLSSSGALAFPAVGDRAEYSGTETISGHSVPFQKTIELTAFDESLNQFKYVETTVQAGQQTNVEETWVDADSLISSAEVEYLLSNCSGDGSVLEKVYVKAGEFDTCKLSNSSDEYGNIGNVPFGFVKLARAGWYMELGAFSSGK